MKGNLIGYYAVLLILCSCNIYRVDIYHVKNNRSYIISIKKDSVRSYATSKTVLGKKEAKSFYHNYIKKFEGNKKGFSPDSLDTEYRTRVEIFRNNKLENVLFLGSNYVIIDTSYIGICDKKYEDYIIEFIPLEKRW